MSLMLQNLTEAISSQKLINIVFISFGAVLTIIVINFIFKFITSGGTSKLHLVFLKRILKAAVIIYAIIGIASNIDGIKNAVATILAGGGIIVVILGFIAQEALSNVLNGMMISIFKPFKIGDRVRLLSSDVAGVIEDISLRHTVIKTFNNSRIIVPNSIMNKSEIENSHFKDERAGAFIDIPLDYNADVEKAIEIVTKIIEVNPFFIDVRTEEDIAQGTPLVIVQVRDININGIWIRANVWAKEIRESFIACSDIRREIILQFREYDIKIYDQRLIKTENII